MLRLRFALAALLLALPWASLAAVIAVPASLNPTTEQATARTEGAETKGYNLTGRGDRVQIAYSSTLPLEIDLAPRRRGNGFDPSEVLYATLPAGEEQTAEIDITGTPAWWPLAQSWSVTFYSPPNEKAAKVHTITFLAPGLRSILTAALRHLGMREHYQVSSYHALRGQNMLGLPLALLMGLATLLVAGCALVWGKSSKASFTVLIIGALFSAGWFGVDLLRFTVSHVREYETQGTYSNAGAVEQMAAAIRKSTAGNAAFVYVCRDSTDFYAKILRCFLYPIPVSVKDEDIPRATHVVVEEKLHWSYENGVLTCGNITGNAAKVAEFADGSALFTSSL